MDEIYAMLYAEGAAQWERPLWSGRARVSATGADELAIEIEGAPPILVSTDEISHWAGGEAIELPTGGRLIFYASELDALRSQRRWQAEWEQARRAMQSELEAILASA